MLRKDLFLSPWRWLGVALLLMLMASTVQAAHIALVIGNDTYTQVTALHNARADARAIARGLADSGFDVTLKLDLGLQDMKQALRQFKAQIAGGDVAVFYYSGHGLQLGAANYLLPVDIRGDSEEQIKDDAIALQRILDDLQERKAKFSLAIIDACRNNPFTAGGRNIGGTGLAPTTAATGQMVLFSAGAGQQALDRLDGEDTDPNGLFTRVFVREMARPGVPVDRVLHNVREQVVKLAKAVNHEQVPALYDQSLGEFYFHPAGTAAASTPSNEPAPPPAAPKPENTAHQRLSSRLSGDNPEMTRSELEQAFTFFMNAWRHRDYQTQASLIANDFFYRDQSKMQNRAEYLENKRRLYRIYPWIVVEASNLQLGTSGSLGVAAFRLHFKSPTYESFGDQRMTFRKTGQRVYLVSEEFQKDR